MTKEELEAIYYTEKSLKVVARKVGICVRQLRAWADIYGLPRRKRQYGRDPSPTEIAAACLEIQRGWSDEERNERARHYADQISESTLIAARKGLK